jgi:hypothetical protein
MSRIFRRAPGACSGYGEDIRILSRREQAMAICGHEGCKCEAREDGFCSDYCAGHADHEGHEAHECGCGHNVCDAQAALE